MSNSATLVNALDMSNISFTNYYNLYRHHLAGALTGTGCPASQRSRAPGLCRPVRVEATVSGRRSSRPAPEPRGHRDKRQSVEGSHLAGQAQRLRGRGP